MGARLPNATPSGARTEKCRGHRGQMAAIQQPCGFAAKGYRGQTGDGPGTKRGQGENLLNSEIHSYIYTH